MTNILIPPGLLDENVELFSAGRMMALHDGQLKILDELPVEFRAALKAEMYKSPSIVVALEMAGIMSQTEQLEKFAECRFGGFDLQADYQNGKFSEAEYHECGFRGTCPMEGVVCGFFKFNGKVITPLEIELIKLLATEDTIPVIAEKLLLSVNTLEIRKKALFEKMGVFSRARLVTMAFNLHILTPAPWHS